MTDGRPTDPTPRPEGKEEGPPALPPEPRGPSEPESADAAPVSPGRIAWRRLRKNRTAMAGGMLLILLYLAAAFGSFLAPYDPGEGNYAYPGHPPTIPRFFDETGRFHPRPFVYGYELVDVERQLWKVDTSRKYPIRFFVEGYPYKLWWIFPTNIHFMGVEQDGLLALLGTDSSGKDVFSRMLQGGKVSLSIGLVGIALSLVIGMFLGGLAGYFGGWLDTLIMRLVEFLLSIPTLYLIIAVRAYFQTNTLFGIGGASLNSTQMYLMIIILLSLIGWAGLARVIRGMVLSLREQEYVLAERALGASTLRIIWRHILPNTMSYVIVSATIAVPGYILGEVALSYLGVGIQEPQVSWGLMLNDAQSIPAMKNTPWLLFAPAAAIFLTVMAFNFLGDGLRDALDPKHTK